VNHLEFTNNEVISKSISLSENTAAATFDLEHCKDVRIENNQFAGFGKKQLNIKHMSKSEIKTKPLSLFD